MKRFLVLGATGFIGSHLAGYFQAVGTSTTMSKDTLQLDLRNRTRLREIVLDQRPEFILNATGIGFEQSRANPGLASLINGEAVGHIAELATDIGARVVQLSTDYVFDGVKGDYTETDSVNPLSVYGSTKLRGESFALQSGGIVIRLGLSYELGYSGRKVTLPESVRRCLTSGQKFRVAEDQRLSPILIQDISCLIEKLLEHQARGLFHAGSPRSITRLEFCRLVAKAYALDPELVLPIHMAEDRFYDERPGDTSLVVRKASEHCNLTDVWEYLNDPSRPQIIDPTHTMANSD